MSAVLKFDEADTQTANNSASSAATQVAHSSTNASLIVNPQRDYSVNINRHFYDPSSNNSTAHQSRASDADLQATFGTRTTNAKSKGFSDSFSANAEWEGTVVRVDQDKFIATLVQLPRGYAMVLGHGKNLDSRVGITEQTEIPIEDVPPADRDLVIPGALFRMVIGYHIASSGQRRRGISVVFRRLPRWRPQDLEKAREEAAAEQSAFNSVPGRL